MSSKNKDSKGKKVRYHKFISNRDVYLYRAFKRECKKGSEYWKFISAAPDVSFYLRIIVIPSFVFVPLLAYLYYLACITYPENPNLTAFSIVIGLFGSYIASVLVTWLLEYNNGKSKTIERLRDQNEYYSLLVEWCAWYCNIQAKAIKNRKNSYALDHAIETINMFVADVDEKIEQQKKASDGQLIKEESVKHLLKRLPGDDRFSLVPDLLRKYGQYAEIAQYTNRVMSFEKNIVLNLCQLIKNVQCDCNEKKYDEFWDDNKELLRVINNVSLEVLPLRLLKREYFYCDADEESNYGDTKAGEE